MVTIGGIKKGDFIQCGKDENNLDIWKVEEITFHTVGAWKDKVRDLIMVNKEGNKKHYAFLEKSESFLNSSFVTSFKYSNLEMELINQLNDILSQNESPSKKLNKIKELINI